MFPKLRRRVFRLLVPISVFGFGAFQFFNFVSVKNIVDFTYDGFEQHDLEVRELLHFSKYKFLLTDEFRKEIGGWRKFAAKSQSDKCLTFFTFLDVKLPNWEVSSFKDQHYEKNVVHKGEFFESELEKIKTRKSKETPPGQITDDDREKVNELYLKALKDSISLEQRMADTTTVIRLFGQCFFSKNSPSLEGPLKDIYNRYSAKMVPFFHPEIPQSAEGHVETNHEWNFDKTGQVKNGNLLDYYYKNMQGTGIAISATTWHSPHIVKLIHLLRALGNNFPIEVLYRSDLLATARQSILLAGALSKEDLLGKELTDAEVLKTAFDRAGLGLSDLENMAFPKQQITFINIDRLLSRMGPDSFASFNNKILAMFFTSFEKVFLFDADAVPLLSLERLLKFKEFAETGAFFFKDRNILDYNDWIDTNYFAKLMPHKSSRIDMAMGIRPVTSHTLDNVFMRGWRHCQEAGIVMLDRRRHFRSLLNLFPLVLWSDPIPTLVWGDKEMYWLALSIAGDEDYAFSHYGAVAVGEVTSASYMKHYPNSKATELCSTHAGHVHADGQLLWINAGFSYCKSNGFSHDELRFPFSVSKNKAEMKAMFEGPLRIRQAILPWELPPLRTLGGSPDMSAEKRFMSVLRKRKPDVDSLAGVDQIDSYDPQQGWIFDDVCHNYQFCAYDAIGAWDDSGKLAKYGHVFTFDARSIRRFDILGAIWTSSIEASTLKGK